ncbi:MAG: hypothetical protein P8J79_02910 [Halioglobus sp.]|nr:hypothetical protein [Halioglobus sp.]
MSIGVLDLNDCNLQLWHEGTTVQSPGYVLLHEKEYLFGSPARAAARLQPRDINTRYWWQLSTELLQPSLGHARHNGDLAHAHLQQLHKEAKGPTEVLLAVSGSMQHEQLALLLGIIEQCPFDAVGLVNRSVALASLHRHGDRLFHLEIQLHQAVISELIRQDHQTELQCTTPLPGCGLLQLQEQLVELIAAAFVRQTRFDPRRKGDSEQQLYDALPAALHTLQNASETNLEINGYQARVSAHELQAAGKRLFDSARNTIGILRPEDHVIIDPLATLLPGLTNQFEQIEVLQEDDVRRALQSHQDRLVQREQALSFVTALPCLSVEGVSSDSSNKVSQATPSRRATEAHVSAAQPTHVLYQHKARPLIASGTPLESGWNIYRSAAGWQLRDSTTAATVNGVTYRSDQILFCGDAISISPDGSDVALLIEVVT